MAVYNVSKIENWYNDFISCRKKFIDVYLDDYQNCYVKQCKDDIANMMRVSLNDNYNKINRLFNNINTFWSNYLNDLKNTDNYMAGTSSVGAINSSAVQAKLKTLPTLATHKVTLDIKTSSIAANTKNWWNNNKDTMAVYGIEIFCDVADLVDQFGDGLYYAIGGVWAGFNTLIGNEKEVTYTENWLKEMIPTDFYSAGREFYLTEKGREINANSKVKYDSETMSNFSEKFTKVLDIGFSFLGKGVISGIVGGIMGGGDAVESYLQENPDASLSDAFSSALVGGLKKGSEYFASGSLFKGGVSFLKSFKGAFTSGGTKTLFSSLSKSFTKEGAKQNLSTIGSKISQMFSKSNVVETLKLALKDPETWLDSLGTASNHIVIDEKTGNAFIDDWKEFFNDASLGFLLNYVFKTGDVKVSSSGTSSSVMDELTNDLKRNYNLDEIEQKVLSGEAKSSIKNKIDDAFSDIKKNFSHFKTTGQTKLSGAKSTISDWFSGLRTNLDETSSKITSRFKNAIDDSSSDIKNKIDDAFSNIRKSIDEFKTKSNTSFSNSKSKISDWFSNIRNNLDETSSKLTLADFKYRKNSTSTDISNYLQSNLKKYVSKNTNYFEGLNDQIKENGLYHFTTSADEILNSGYIKNSDAISSYGLPKTYFFNGIPSVGQVATNLDNVPTRITAVKVNPSDEIINSDKLKVRNLDDGAISYDGKFNLDGSVAEKKYLCLYKENDELVYKEVPKSVYDNYPNTFEAKQISDFVNDKTNVKAIKSSYLAQLKN